MATLSRGKTFGATEEVTNAKLHQLVDSATISGIAQTDFAANIGVVSVATSAPSDTDQLWLDTSVSPYILKHYDGNAWVPSAEYGSYTNNTGATTSVGQVVIIDTATANNVKFTSTAGDKLFRGIVAEAIADGSTVDVIARGVVTPLLETSASAGCFLRTSTATGKAEPVAAGTDGVFGYVQEAGTASAKSYIFGFADNAGVGAGDTIDWTGTQTFLSATLSDLQPVVQQVFASAEASAAVSTTLPADDTIPQQTGEGTEIITASITPKATANRLVIEAITYSAGVSTGVRAGGALFQDSTENALASGLSSGELSGGGADTAIIHVRHEMAAGTTSSTTFKFKVGPLTAATLYVLGTSAARLFGGTLRTTLRITEYKT